MFGSIVVGTDGSETAREAVRQATELAKQVGDSIDLVSAYEPVSSGRLLDRRRGVEQTVAVARVIACRSEVAGRSLEALLDGVRRGAASDDPGGDHERRGGGHVRRGHRGALIAGGQAEAADRTAGVG